MDEGLTSKNKDNVISELMELIDTFSVMIYRKRNNEPYNLLIKIIDKLDLIIGEKSNLQMNSSNKIYIQNLTGKLPYLLDAFENNDNVLISDILKYEIKPILEKLNKDRYIN